ncbi:MAG: SOS response-associated peptidase [Verrucomicrobiota bacterium]
MCGRYTIHIAKQKIVEAIDLEIPEAYEPDYNIGPGRDALALSRKKDDGLSAKMMRWGLRTPQNFHINARIETADTKPRFRDAWSTQRCLIPANGFYEWQSDGIRKQPYYIYSAENELIFFAGIWFTSLKTDQSDCFIILTTQANQSIDDVHLRMPVCLPQSFHSDWLAHILPKSEVSRIASNTVFEKHSVSSRVNSVRNNDHKLVLERTPQNDDQLQLF